MSYRRVIVSVDGALVVVEHEATQPLPELGTQVEHQGTAFLRIYDAVSSESAIVVRRL